MEPGVLLELLSEYGQVQNFKATSNGTNSNINCTRQFMDLFYSSVINHLKKKKTHTHDGNEIDQIILILNYDDCHSRN